MLRESGEGGVVSEHYDVVVVGGGPAGSVLAARLTERADRQVLLIEAGPDYGADAGKWPAEMLDHVGLGLESHSWGYFDKETPEGRRLQLPRARVLGGNSTVNGCIWLRGSRSDYDAWEALGNPGWSFSSLLPAFRKAESDPAGGQLHGESGPVPVWRVPDAKLSRLDRAFMESAQENGLPLLADLNAAADQIPAVGKTPKNIAGGHRFNAAFSYLAASRERPNLTILPDTLVDRVILEGRRASGVLTVDGREILAREVILSSGAYGSPAVLMRSGIGPADELRRIGVESFLDLPGVGSHLMDHPQLARQSGLTSFRILPEHTPDGKTFIQTMVKARSRWAGGDVDLHLYPAEAFDERFGGWTIAFGVSLQFARSKGTVRLTSPDPEAALEIDHNYFSHPDDLEALCDGFELLQRLTSTPPLSRMLDGPCIDGEHLRDRDALKAAIRREVGTTYHPSSTCRMGPASDPTAVVDAQGCVHGLTGLRVVDASIFPFGPRANLHFTVVAAAEHIAARMVSES